MHMMDEDERDIDGVGSMGQRAHAGPPTVAWLFRQ